MTRTLKRQPIHFVSGIGRPEPARQNAAPQRKGWMRLLASHPCFYILFLGVCGPLAVLAAVGLIVAATLLPFAAVFGW